MALLCVVCSSVCVTFPYGVPSQVWYLIVSLLPTYKLFKMTSMPAAAIWMVGRAGVPATPTCKPVYFETDELPALCCVSAISRKILQQKLYPARQIIDKLRF